MNWLPIIIGKSPRRIVKETLAECGLSERVNTVLLDDSKRVVFEDNNIRPGFTYLPLLETLAREDDASSYETLNDYDKYKYFIDVFICGRDFPNRVISSGPYDKEGNQEQIIIGNNIFLDREIITPSGKDMPYAYVRECFSNLLKSRDPERLYYKVLDSFIEDIFSDLSDHGSGFSRNSSLEFVKDDDDPKKTLETNKVYRVKLIMLSETTVDFGEGGLYGKIKPRLLELGYNPIETNQQV